MTVSYTFSTMHWFFPKIIIGILVILGVMLIIQRIMKCKKTGTPFLNLKGYRFFQPGYDKVKFWGSIVLFIAYVASLEAIGFLAASCIFITLYNLLFAEAIYGPEKGFKVDWKNVGVSALIGVVSSTFIWVLFYKIFNITLP
ncbi:MAG: tripartite tricarboxylate transporter TctB family protein [Clostridia bacterium]|nr:tripartite tricarboxylate transporter TctB family protein [Clostridia bacterium]